MELRLIGDSHGKVSRGNFLQGHSIVLGDNGFKRNYEEFEKVRTDEQFILYGNHDYYPQVYSKQSLWDYAIIDTGNHKILCLRGAWSVDKAMRSEGISWFKEEQLTYQQCQNILDHVSDMEFDIIITHDCPMSIKEKVWGYGNKTITNNFLQEILDEINPDYWYYGHYHKSNTININKTQFICLAELEIYDIQIEKFNLKKYKT